MHTFSFIIRCDVCDLGFKQAVHLKSHKLKHSDTKEFKCQFCDQSFSFKASIRKHMLRFHGTSSETEDGLAFKCLRCENRFASMEELKVHRKEAHSNRKLYFCQLCNLEFSRCRELESHNKKLHRNASNGDTVTSGSSSLGFQISVNRLSGDRNSDHPLPVYIKQEISESSQEFKSVDTIGELNDSESSNKSKKRKKKQFPKVLLKRKTSVSEYADSNDIETNSPINDNILGSMQEEPDEDYRHGNNDSTLMNNDVKVKTEPCDDYWESHDFSASESHDQHIQSGVTKSEPVDWLPESCDPSSDSHVLDTDLSPEWNAESASSLTNESLVKDSTEETTGTPDTKSGFVNEAEF